MQLSIYAVSILSLIHVCRSLKTEKEAEDHAARQFAPSFALSISGGESTRGSLGCAAVWAHGWLTGLTVCWPWLLKCPEAAAKTRLRCLPVQDPSVTYLQRAHTFCTSCTWADGQMGRPVYCNSSTALTHQRVALPRWYATDTTGRWNHAGS